MFFLIEFDIGTPSIWFNCRYGFGVHLFFIGFHCCFVPLKDWMNALRLQGKKNVELNKESGR